MEGDDLIDYELILVILHMSIYYFVMLVQCSLFQAQSYRSRLL